MTVAYQMPVRTELATKVGPRLWRKPILKAGHISKNGIELDVDRTLLETYAQNFAAGAKDKVQFLAGHDEDNLEAFRGDLVGLEVTPSDELVGLFQVTDRADRMLAENPNLGASVSVVDRLERADGRNYGPTLLHVAGTFDPEVSGLGGWVRAELSASKTQVIDLSTTDESSARAAARQTPAASGEDTEKGAGPVAQATEEELTQLRALLPKLMKLVGGDAAGDTTDAADNAPEGEEETDAENSAIDAALADTDDTTAEASTTGDAADTATAAPQLVAAAAEQTEALNLATARIDAQAVELAAMRRERDEERYKAEKVDLARNFGIPADVTELAKPLLYGTGRKVELSAGKTVDAGAVMRKVLHELGRRYAKALDLGAEYGTADAQDDAAKRQADLDAFVASVNDTERR